MGVITEHITKKLEKDIREKGLLIWLDKNGDYTTLIDNLIANRSEGTSFYEVYAFRGSFLQLMIETKEILSSRTKPKCVIHMPGFNYSDIRDTPVLEAYKAGQKWEKALSTMIREAAQGRLTEDQTKYLLEKDELTLEQAEEFFSQEESIPEEVKKLLQKYGEDGFILQFLKDPEQINTELCMDGISCFNCLSKYFITFVGLDDEWRKDWNPDWERRNDKTNFYGNPENQAEILISYLMAMEFVHDLKGSPQSHRLIRLKDKSKEFARKSSDLLKMLREREPERYIYWAERVESNLSEGECRQNPKLLGSLDTFRFEADIFLNEAISCLKQEKWNEALELATTRLPKNRHNSIAQTFWLQQDKVRLWLWVWIESASRLGDGISLINEQLPRLQTVSDHGRLIDLYSSDWARADHYHRDFIAATDQYQQTSTDLHTNAFISVRIRLQKMYRECLDNQSMLWNGLCERAGFLPEPSLQQREFYNQWVKPVAEKGQKTALFFVDALRYELGIQLTDLLSDIKPQIKPMVAELPTVTAIGMNALCPVVSEGNLTPIFNAKGQPSGFQGVTKQILSPSDRKKAYGDHLGKEIAWETMGDFLDLTDRKLKRFSAHDFVVITVPEIDSMGESGALRLGLDYFNTMIKRIKNSIDKLKGLGFIEFLVTSDHGFLLGDDTLTVNRSPKLSQIDRRHALDTPRNSMDLISADPQQLNYHVEERGKSFIFDRTTHILNANRKDFYHGGNTLQERLVPVITFSYTKQQPDNTGTFALKIRRGEELMGMNRIYVTPQSKGGDLFALEKIEVQFRSEEGISLEIQHVGNGSRVGNILSLSVGEEAEILFTLVKGNKSNARIFLEPTQSGTVIEKSEFGEYFRVSQVVEDAITDEGHEPVKVEPVREVKASGYPSEIPEHFHSALAHLDKHGSLTEIFLMNTLGGDSKASRLSRKFANYIHEWMPLLPFDIIIEQTAEGKTYRKQ